MQYLKVTFLKIFYIMLVTRPKEVF